ncbi:MAG: hypothetical protein ACOX2F_12135 [bacterium]
MKKAIICFCSILILSTLLFPCDEECRRGFLLADCEKGDFRACLRLGDYHFYKENFVLAQFIYEQGFNNLKIKCANDSPEDCISLAILYEIGRGTEKNIDEAAYIFHDLCNKGNCEGCRHLFRLIDERKITDESQYFQCGEKHYLVH